MSLFMFHHTQTRPACHWRRILLGAGLCALLLSGTALASPTLQPGSHGHDVLVLQQKLQKIGYNVGGADGIYGQGTERAVAEFQRDNKIRITGVVNNSTWRALLKAKKRPWGSQVKPPAHNKPAVPQPNGGWAQSRELAPNGTTILPRSKVQSLIFTAKKYMGTPYVFGGSTPKAFDCSGYLQYIFRENGIEIPRTADEQYKLGRRTTSARELVPGDLVFFTTYEPGASHCGLYLGQGDFIHASSSKGVRVDNLSNGYWAPKYLGGKHIVK